MDTNRKVPRAVVMTLTLLAVACGQTDQGNSAGTGGHEAPVATEPVQVQDSAEPARPIEEPESVRESEPLESISEGIALVQTNLPDDPDSRVVFVKLQSASFRPHVVGLTEQFPAGRSGQAAADEPNVRIVLGSGFVVNFYPPTPAGLLVVDGATVGPLFGAGHSTIVFVRDGDLHFADRDDTRAVRGARGAVQVGPRLVQNGRIGIHSSEPRDRAPATRAFIAACGTAMIAGITETPVSLYHLARYLGLSNAEGGLGCTDAANLSGGGSELLIVKSSAGETVFTGGNTTVRQAALITFTPS